MLILHTMLRWLAFGAKGIGLTRTEHMFFDDQKIVAMREMILADSVEGREKALAKLLPIRKLTSTASPKAMDGCHVNIRLLDPPLTNSYRTTRPARRLWLGNGCKR